MIQRNSDEIELNLKKIAASQYGSFAIDHKGDLLIWGRCNLFPEARLIPTLQKQTRNHPYYRGTHVAAGINHGAMVMECQLSKLVKERPAELPSSAEAVLEVQRTFLKEKGEKEDAIFLSNYRKFCSITEFRIMMNTIFKEVRYRDESKDSVKVSDPHTHTKFEKAFEPIEVVDEENLRGKPCIDLLFYYQQLCGKSRKDTITLIWGSKANGRLGLKKLETQKSQVIATQSHLSKPVSRISQIQQDIEKSDVQPITLMSKSFIKICCGHHHTMAIDDEYKLYVWGMGNQGCLGTGSIEDVNMPQELPLDSSFTIEIAAGAFHSIVLTMNSAYAWGNNSRGQLGIGNKVNQLKPCEVTYFNKKSVEAAKLFAGDQHSACITSSKELYTWGNGDYFRLGHGMIIDEIEPKKVEILQDVYVLDCSLGTVHSICVTNEGFVYAWGSSREGILAIPTQQYKDQTLPQRAGIENQNFRDTSFFQVAAGTSHSLGLANNGHLYSWGSNKFQKLGVKLQTGQDFTDQPVRVPQMEDNSEIQDAKFYCDNQEIAEDKQMPLPESIVYNLKMLKTPKTDKHECRYKFAIGSAHNSFFIDTCGKLYGCGSNRCGLLCRDPDNKKHFKQYLPDDPGEKFLEECYNPIEIPFFKQTEVTFISCSYNHAIAITSKGSAYCWGQNRQFQLGLGFSSQYVFTPIKLESAIQQKHLVQSICGEHFSAVLTDSGEVWSFGTSQFGVLGHEKKTYYVVMEPRMINDIDRVIYLTCSNQTVMAITDQQKLLVWGNNQFGQLGISLGDEIQGQGGDGTKDAQANLLAELKTLKNPENYIIFQPKEAMVRSLLGEVKVKQVACGLYHSLVITEADDILSCGLNKYSGHSLNESEEDRAKGDKELAPKFVDQFAQIFQLASKKFKNIAAHETHTLAITVMGEYLGWGQSDKQQLGKVGNSVTETKLISLAPGVHIQYFACGQSHSIGISDKFEIYSWGNPLDGRLGADIRDINNKQIQKWIYNVKCYPCYELASGKAPKVSSKSKRTSKKGGTGKKKQKAKQVEVIGSSDDEEVLDEVSYASNEEEVDPKSMIEGKKKILDPLQRGLAKQTYDYEAENLYIQDAEIDRRINNIFKDVAVNAWKQQCLYSEYNSKISQISDYRSKQLASINQVKAIQNLKFSIPQFIVKNIQIYEGIFSTIYHHPCYIIKMIESGLVNTNDILILIRLIYRNDLMNSNNQATMLTIAMNAFKVEFKNQENKISYLAELKVFKSKSFFHEVYLLCLLRDKPSVDYFQEMALLLVNHMLQYTFTEFTNKQTEDEATKTTIMEQIFDLNKEQSDQSSQTQYKAFEEGIIRLTKDIKDKYDKCRKSGELMASHQILYLHSSIVTHARNTILEEQSQLIKGLQDHPDELSRKLQTIAASLDLKIKDFIINLYFGTVTYFIKRIADQKKEIGNDLQFMLGASNLEGISDVVTHYFTKTPLLQNPYNATLNHLIQSRTIEKSNISEIAPSLYQETDFSIEYMGMKELIEECFKIEDRYLSVEIDNITSLQTTYCQQINHNAKAVQQLFVRGYEDPIYIMLRHLNFREIQANLFSTEILKRKVNIKLMKCPLLQEAKRTSEMTLFRCEFCQIVTTKIYIALDKQRALQKLLDTGWICNKGHKNPLGVLDCESTGCNEFIVQEALKTSRILQYYYRGKDEDVDKLVEILINIPTIEKDQDMYNHLKNLKGTTAVRKNTKLLGDIEKFFSRVLPTKFESKEKEKENPEELKYKFMLRYNAIHGKAELEYKQRQKHRQLQLSYIQLINHLEALFEDYKLKTEILVHRMKELERRLRFNIKIVQPTDQYEENKPQRRSYGFFTYESLLVNKSLVKITFKNKQIPKIVSNIKFYCFGLENGGWHIQLVYLQNDLLNYLVKWCNSIYPIELSLFLIEIPIEQYLELRRMSKYRTQITFKSQNIEVTFNILKLIEMFKQLDARLIQ